MELLASILDSYLKNKYRWEEITEIFFVIIGFTIIARWIFFFFYNRVKVGRFEILFNEKGNAVSILEDLDEHKIQINPVIRYIRGYGAMSNTGKREWKAL